MPPAHARYAKKPRRAPPPEADAPRAPRRQAVLVGVGGAVSDGAGSVLGELRAHRDVQAIRALLVDVLGFRPHDVVAMLDADGVKAHLRPTKANIVKQLKRMVRHSRAGDSYFFFYAGHGTQGRCDSDTESDGYDEYIHTADGRSIKDNRLHNLLVRPLPRGARLLALFDACHAGTLLDLPHGACCNGPASVGLGLAFLSAARVLRAVLAHRNGLGAPASPVAVAPPPPSALTVVMAASAGDENTPPADAPAPVSRGRRTAPLSPVDTKPARCDGLCDACEPPGALVVSLAASADDELSFEGALGGLMTGAFVEIMRARRDLTYQDLMVDLRAKFASMYRERVEIASRYRGSPDFDPDWECTQRPQLTSLHPLDLKQPLII